MVFVFQTGPVQKQKEAPEEDGKWQNTRDSIITKTAPYVKPVATKLVPMVKKTLKDSGTELGAALELIIGGAIAIGAISAFRQRGAVKNATLPHFAIVLQERLERLILENTVENPDAQVSTKFKEGIRGYAAANSMTYEDAQKVFVETTLKNIYGNERTGDIRTSLKTKRFRRGWPIGKNWKNFWKRRRGIEKRLPGAIDASIRQFGVWDFNYSEYLTVGRLNDVPYARTINRAENGRTAQAVFEQLRANGLRFRNTKKTLARLEKFVGSDKYKLSFKDANGRSVDVMKDSQTIQTYIDNLEGANVLKNSTKAFSKEVLGGWKSSSGFGGSEYAKEYRRQVVKHIRGNFGALFFEQEAHVINKAVAKNPNFWNELAENGTINETTLHAIRAGVRWPEALVNEGGARRALEKRAEIAKQEKTGWDTWSPYWKMSKKDQLMAGWRNPEETAMPGLSGSIKGKVMEGLMERQIYFKSVRPNNTLTRGVLYAGGAYLLPPVLAYGIPPVVEYMYNNPDAFLYAADAGLLEYVARSFYYGRNIRAMLALSGAGALTYFLVSGPFSEPKKEKKIDPNQAPDYSARIGLQDPNPQYKWDIKKGLLLEGTTTSGGSYVKGLPRTGIEFKQNEYVEYYFTAKAPPVDMSNVPELRIYGMNGNTPTRNTGLLSIRILPNGVAYGQGVGMVEYEKNGQPYALRRDADPGKSEDVTLQVRIYKDGKCGIVGWASDGTEIIPYRYINLSSEQTAWDEIRNAPPSSYRLYETVRVYPVEEKK